jgi:hypothetical protein
MLRCQVDGVEEAGGAFGRRLQGEGELHGFFLFVGVFVSVIFVSLLTAEWRRGECGRSTKPERREDGIAEKVRNVFKGRAMERAADVEFVLPLPKVTAPAYACLGLPDYSTTTAVLETDDELGTRAGNETVPVCGGRGGVGGD